MTYRTSFATSFDPRICRPRVCHPRICHPRICNMDTFAASGRRSNRTFAAVSALLFAAGASLTALWCASMPGGMPMPGGWSMSMAWMRMPGQTWPAAALSFAAMWTVMMIAMMLPSLAPALWRYREAVARTGESRLGRLTALVALAYFLVWAMFGMAVYPAGVALAAVEMRHRALAAAVPMAAGIVVLMAGAFQFAPWKAHHLACCREAQGRGRTLPADAATAWRLGLRQGLHCACGCAGLTAILLAIGIMDLRAMAVVTAAITAERLAPDRRVAGDVPESQRVAQAIGVLAVVAGLYLIVRAAGLA